MVDLAVLTADRVQAEAIGGGVMISGAGMAQALLTGSRLRETLAVGTPVALSGVAYALDPTIRPGQLVVATELWATDGTPRRRLPASTAVARDLQRLGLSVRTGPLVSASGALATEEAARLAGDGAIAWDTESAWVALHLVDHPVAAVRVIADPQKGQTLAALEFAFGCPYLARTLGPRQPLAPCTARESTLVLCRRRTGDRNRRTCAGAIRQSGVRPQTDRS